MSSNGVSRTLRMLATAAVAFFGGTFALGFLTSSISGRLTLHKRVIYECMGAKFCKSTLIALGIQNMMIDEVFIQFLFLCPINSHRLCIATHGVKF